MNILELQIQFDELCQAPSEEKDYIKLNNLSKVLQAQGELEGAYSKLYSYGFDLPYEYSSEPDINAYNLCIEFGI